MITDEKAKEQLGMISKEINEEELIKKIKEITSHWDSPEEAPFIVSDVHMDAWKCYIFGIFKGCIIFSIASIEKALKEELKKKGVKENKFYKIIQLAQSLDILSCETAEITKELKDRYRNVYVHLDTDAFYYYRNIPKIQEDIDFHYVEEEEAKEVYEKATKILEEIYSKY